jgi:hypothetical protein
MRVTRGRVLQALGRTLWGTDIEDDWINKCGVRYCGNDRTSAIHGPIEACSDSIDAREGRHRDFEHHAYVDKIDTLIAALNEGD